MEFDREFQEVIVSKILRDDKFLRENVDLLEKDHFSGDVIRFMVASARDHYLKYNGERITSKILLEELRPVIAKKEKEEREVWLEAVKRIYKIDLSRGVTYTRDKFIEFIDTESFKRSMLEAVDVFQAGKMDEAKSILQKGLSNSKRNGYKHDELVAGFLNRQDERKIRATSGTIHSIPTMIEAFDKRMRGIQPGELGLVAGTTGRGKSIMLTQLGYVAWFLGYDVLHLSLENSLWQTTQRYDSKAHKVSYDKFKWWNFDKTDIESIDINLKNFGKKKNKLVMVNIPARTCNILLINKIFNEMQAYYGCKFGLVINDYADLMEPLKSYKDHRLNQTAVYWDYKSFLVDKDIPGWTATQAKQEYARKRAYSESVSDSYDKARAADIIVTLNQTQQEEDEEEMTAILAKYRDGKGHVAVKLGCSFDVMTYIEKREIASISSEEEEVELPGD